MRWWYPVLGLLLAGSVLILGYVALQSGAVQSFPATGRIVGFGADSQQVFIAHGNIPGLMPAMTMPFAVADPGILSDLAFDDSVSFRVEIASGKTLASNFAVVARGVGGSAGGSPPGGPDVGSRPPDVQLTDQDGRAFAFPGPEGRALIVTFVYTRCPLPDYCPLMSLQFQQLQSLLEDRLGDRLGLVSISFDPDHDTPNVLKEYAARYTRDTSTWTFATGTTDQIGALTRYFGVSYEQNGAQFDHNLMTALLGSDGRVVHVWTGNSWTPQEVLVALSALEQAS